MKVLGIDYGTKRIGLAVGDTEIGIAFPREVLLNDEFFFPNIRTLCEQEHIALLVIGDPLLPRGGETQETRNAREFAKQCQKEFPSRSVILWDERYSSKTAQQSARAMGHTSKTFRGNLDAAAAALLLQTYFDSHSSSS